MNATSSFAWLAGLTILGISSSPGPGIAPVRDQQDRNAINLINGNHEQVVYKDSLSLLRVYPNPNSGQFVLQLPGETIADGSRLVIWSLQGKKIMETILAKEYGNRVSINITGSPAGIYLLSLEWNQVVFTSRFLVQ